MKPLVKAVAAKALAGFIEPQPKTHVDYWEVVPSKSAWFARPEFSAADIMMSFPPETGATWARAGDRPHVKAFLTKIHARPAYQRALRAQRALRYA